MVKEMTKTLKLSAVLKELAMLVLRTPAKVPSSEAMHAGLLLAHMAWNRALGFDTGAQVYAPMLGVLTSHNPGFWSELCLRDPEVLIETIRQAKEKRYPLDRRVVLVGGIREGNVHVEWCEEHEYPQAVKLLHSRLGQTPIS
jgi:hypothetical protein